MCIRDSHHVHLRGDCLMPETEGVDRRRKRPQLFDLLARAEEERLARAHGGAHRLLADARPVVTHVALHHDLAVFVHLGHAERARHDAVAARDAARLACRLHHAVGGALDGVRRTDLGARRLLAVHADDGDRLHAFRAVDVFEVDHRLAAMRVALRARLHAGLAPDAPVSYTHLTLPTSDLV